MAFKFLNRPVAIGLAVAAIGGYVFIKTVVKVALKQSSKTPETTFVNVTAQQPEVDLISQDGKTKIRLAPGWSNNRRADTPAKSGIKAASDDRRTHLVISTEPKVGEMTAFQLAEMTIKGSGRSMMKDPKIERTGLKQVNTYHAVQYKAEGPMTHKGVTREIVLLLTVVETPNHFHIISAASPSEVYPDQQANLNRMIQSFREVKTTAEVP